MGPSMSFIGGLSRFFSDVRPIPVGCVGLKSERIDLLELSLLKCVDDLRELGRGASFSPETDSSEDEYWFSSSE